MRFTRLLYSSAFSELVEPCADAMCRLRRLCISLTISSFRLIASLVSYLGTFKHINRLYNPISSRRMVNCQKLQFQPSLQARFSGPRSLFIETMPIRKSKKIKIDP